MDKLSEDKYTQILLQLHRAYNSYVDSLLEIAMYINLNDKARLREEIVNEMIDNEELLHESFK